MGISVGSVIGRSLGIFFKNFFAFMVICAIALSPVLIYLINLVMTPMTLTKLMHLDQELALWLFITIGLSFIASGGVTYGVIMQLRGQHASMLDCLRVGVVRMLAVIGVTILTVLAFVGPIIPGAAMAAAAGGGAGVIFVLAGVVISIVIYCRLWLAVPVAVVERPGVFASLSRSGQLTEGSRGSIFGILFVIQLVRWGVQKIIEAVVDVKSSRTFDEAISRVKAYLVALMVLQLLFTAFSAVCCAVAYHDQRTQKEGTSVDELASVFD